MTRWLALSVLISLAACGGDDDERVVPFRAGETRTPPTADQPPSPDAPPAAPAIPGFVPLASAPAPEGTTTLPLDGQTITFGGFTIVGTLAADLDADGDRDALVMLSGPTEIALGLAKREPERFVQTIIAREPFATGCRVERASARLLAPEIGSFEGGLVCGDRHTQVIWPLALDATPSVITRLSIEPPMPDTPVPAEIVATAEVADVNGDTTLDFSLRLAVTPRDGATVQSRLTWLNMPSGLALHRASLQPSITPLARDAKAKLVRDPRRAAELALGALSIAASFCKEQGVPHVRIDGSLGMACGRLTGLSRSSAVRAAAFLRTNAPYDAHLALAVAHALGIRIAHDDAPIIAEALDRMTLIATATWQNLGDIGPTHDEHAPYDALHFEADDVLAIRATPPVRVRLPATTPEPAQDFVLPMLSADNAYAVLDTQHTCHGDIVRLVSPDGRRVRAGHPRLATQPLPTPAPAPCTPDPSIRAHASMYTVLGFTPEGLVVMLGARTFDLVVDPRGQSHGLLTARADATTLPASISGPAVTPDGQTLALNMEAGVLVRSPEGLRVLRGDAFAATRTTIPTAAVAVSPNGHRIAVLRGKTVWVASF